MWWVGCWAGMGGSSSVPLVWGSMAWWVVVDVEGGGEGGGGRWIQTNHYLHTMEYYPPELRQRSTLHATHTITNTHDSARMV